MKLIIAEHSGICFGVKKALEIAERFAESQSKVYTLGPLIHNKQVVEELNHKGIRAIETLDAIEGGTVIIRSHGAPPEVHGHVGKKVVELVDATCPFVRKVQEKVKEYYSKGYQIIIAGDKEHPEVKGVNGWCDYNAIIVDSPLEAQNIGYFEKMCVVAQTTIPIKLWEELTVILENKGDEVQFFNTICSATYLRQQAAVELSKKVDVMLVIGGLHSSNTQKLYKICKENCVRTYHLETAEELPVENIKGAESVGVTAGASTPDWIIKEVIDKMTEMDDVRLNAEDKELMEQQKTEESRDNEEQEALDGTGDSGQNIAQDKEDIPQDKEDIPQDKEDIPQDKEDIPEDKEDIPEDKEDIPEDREDIPEDKEDIPDNKEDIAGGQEDDGNEKPDTMEDLQDTLVTIKVGKVVKGKVLQVGENDVIVNIGYKSDGIIPGDELTNDPSLKPSDIVKEGEEIEVFIRKIDEKEGIVQLSKKKVDIEKAWKLLKEKHETGEPVQVKVLEEVKGGLIVISEGIKGFVPASHIDIGYVEVLQDFVNQELSMKVIEFNRSKGKVIFSRKALLEEEKEQKKNEILSSIKTGDKIEGEVKRLTDFGAFVDVGGIDGLVHISEMSWNRIGHPSEMLEAGQRVEVLVLNVDPENERISLSIKQVKPHPWDNIQGKYSAGEIITGKVVRLVDFGAFVELEPGVEGLVHISQIAYEHIERPEDVLQEGQQVEVKVLDIKPDDRRISLSIKETTEKPKQEDNRAKRQDQSVHSEDPPLTIGELVGDIFNQEK